jgi:hypothetical protein
VSPETHQAIYVDLQTTEIATARIPAPDAFYFLMAFHWLKVYPTEAQSSAIFKCDDKTVRGEVWKYVRAIQALKGQKVRAERTFAEMIIDSSLFHFLHQGLCSSIHFSLCTCPPSLFDSLLFLSLHSFNRSSGQPAQPVLLAWDKFLSL